jgi:hypothetical protein
MPCHTIRYRQHIFSIFTQNKNVHHYHKFVRARKREYHGTPKKETSRICKNECITKGPKQQKRSTFKNINNNTSIISSRCLCSISFIDTSSAGILHAYSHPCRRSRFFEAQSDHFHDHPSRRPWHDSNLHRWYSDPGRLLVPR